MSSSSLLLLPNLQLILIKNYCFNPISLNAERRGININLKSEFFKLNFRLPKLAETIGDKILVLKRRKNGYGQWHTWQSGCLQLYLKILELDSSCRTIKHSLSDDKEKTKINQKWGQEWTILKSQHTNTKKLGRNLD